MCDPLTGMLLLAGAGGMAAGQLMSPKMPKIPDPQEPQKPSQAGKAPDRSAMAGANVSATMPMGALAGNSSTFLTGATGVDPGALNLGKNTLLGQ